MNSKLLGGILLVIGTTIGAGMLALPVATAQLGFWGSSLLLISSWIIMAICAFLFLEVNLWLPPNSNLVSMAGATLGRAGQALTWVVYLVLLYSILSAYISGGGDLFHYILASGGIKMPTAVASIVFTCAFGAVVYLGIRAVDYVNRGLMFGKLGALVILILLIMPFVSSVNLDSGQLKYITSPLSITVTAVAFGCLMIIPSLRTYFGENMADLRKAILIGTLIPLICYIAWDMVIMGVVPLDGPSGLKALLHADGANSGLVSTLTSILNKETITKIAKFFTAICMATSFLSVSLSLSDFLSDGLSIAKRGMGHAVIMAGTFLPPLLVVIFYPDAFLRGMEYAGISIVILMMLLPPIMVWRGRYSTDLATVEGYRVGGGKMLLGLLIAVAAVTVYMALRGLI